MKTYNVQKRVKTGSNTEIFDTVSFDCLDKAEEKFIEILAVQETYAGECNDNDFRDYYQEDDSPQIPQTRYFLVQCVLDVAHDCLA